jgi:ATP-binding cassette subfamily B protein
LAQLAVPRLVGNIIDAVTQGVLAQNVLTALEKIPAALLPQALPRILDALGYPSSWTVEQLQATLTLQISSAPRALVTASLAIVVFAALRGLFAFLQVYWSERNSQSVSFDLRNDLYAKVQRLSFSYHDRNQTGQLMVRATDDVEKVRLFIGQGLLQLVGAVVLLSGTLFILMTTNMRMTLVILPILPAAIIVFMIFGVISQPLFTKLQIRLSAMNTLLQENLAGIKLVKAFTREKSEQAKFERSVSSVMEQQLTIIRVFAFLFPLVFLIANLGQAATLFFGGRQIILGTMTLGEWQEFSLYLSTPYRRNSGFIITQLGWLCLRRPTFEILTHVARSPTDRTP